jgi:hypothetical protein
VEKTAQKYGVIKITAQSNQSPNGKKIGQSGRPYPYIRRQKMEFSQT